MCRPEYDLTYDDLNPTFLFFCELKRTESENNYHCHEHIELSIVKKGHCTFYIDGKEYPVKQGDLIILNPGAYHKSLYTCPDEMCIRDRSVPGRSVQTPQNPPSGRYALPARISPACAFSSTSFWKCCT